MQSGLSQSWSNKSWIQCTHSEKDTNPLGDLKAPILSSKWSPKSIMNLDKYLQEEALLTQLNCDSIINI
jgi:hypothetical protein